MSDSSLWIYRRLEDPVRLASALVQRGNLESVREQHDECVAAFEEALTLLDRERQPWLWMAASYNLATELHVMGEHREAAARLAELRPAMEAHAKPLNRLQVQWFEGIVARDLGEHERAAELLQRTRRSYVEQGIAGNAALVSLDLALLYLEQGRVAETRRLAIETLPIFRSRAIHHEATAALLLFYRAALAETATAAMVREVASTVRQRQTQREHPGDEASS